MAGWCTKNGTNPPLVVSRREVQDKEKNAISLTLKKHSCFLTRTWWWYIEFLICTVLQGVHNVNRSVLYRGQDQAFLQHHQVCVLYCTMKLLEDTFQWWRGRLYRKTLMLMVLCWSLLDYGWMTGVWMKLKASMKLGLTSNMALNTNSHKCAVANSPMKLCKLNARPFWGSHWMSQ